MTKADFRQVSGQIFATLCPDFTWPVDSFWPKPFAEIMPEHFA